MPKAKIDFTDSDLPVGVRCYDTGFDQVISNAADWVGSRVVADSLIGPDGTLYYVTDDYTLIPYGAFTGYGGVLGTSYYLHGIRCQGMVTSSITADATDVPTPACVRLSLVLDRQPHGAYADGADIFTALGTSALFSFLAQGAGNGGRFLLLRDVYLDLDPACAGTDGPSTLSTVLTGQPFDLSHTFNSPLCVDIQATSSGIVANISSNNLLIIARSTSGTQRLVGCCRAYYSDLVW